MDRISMPVRKEFCDDCALALRRFIGRMPGVDEINVEGGSILISFDPLRISAEDLRRITGESIEKLGYKIDQD